jgi:predicted dehydrogenase
MPRSLKTLLWLLAACPALLFGQNKPMRLIVLDPGHFHATLLQKDMYPELASRVSVYAPLGPELLDYLNRVSLFNSRADNPTRWELDVHCTSNSLDELLHDRAGDIVVFTGRNRGKIDRMLSTLAAGLHALADKPWIISSSDMPKLEQALDLAERKGVAAYDIMTERYEVTSELQRALVNSPEVFGEPVKGTAENPGVTAKSIHHVMKVVAGVPLRRPAWFFDIAEYGEGLADVGTHVVDLVQWTLAPGQAIDYHQDIRVLDGQRWPLKLSKEQFQAVTGRPDFPPELASNVHGGQFDYYCNNAVHYTFRGIHVKMDILWNWEAPAGSGDVYEAAFHGTRSSAEIRQGAAEKFVPELYIVPSAGSQAAVMTTLKHRVDELQSQWPGVAVEQHGTEARIVIPNRLRVGHEEHFAQVAHRFLDYAKSPKSMPAWERNYMLAKYYVSTKGVELALKKH